jgi:CubicO group peptidase (beta-lactamase class C family)
MSKIRILGWVFALTVLALVSNVRGQSVIAVGNTSNRTIHLIDQTTGAINKTVGVHAEVCGLASDDGEQIFYYTDQDGLYSVPYNGGVSTLIGYFHGDTSTIFGLAFHEPSSTLYGCNNGGIYVIDTSDAESTLFFNPPGTNELSGIEVDKWTSKFYICDDNGSGVDGPGVYELNLNNMNYFSVLAPYPSSLSDVDGLAVNNGFAYLVEDGNLLGDRIHEVDLSSGFVTRTFIPPFAAGGANSAGAFATPDNLNTPVGGVPVPELAILDTTMIDYMRLRDISAGTLSVMRDGVIVYHRVFGWRDAERQNNLPSYTIMRLASVTKPLTAAAIRELINDGLLSLNRRVFNNGNNNGILTYTPFGTPDPRIYDITVDHLLHHEGGWDRSIAGDLTYRELQIADEMNIDSPPGRDATVRWIMGQPLQFDPGSDSAYSNIGYLLLGLIVEEISGDSHLTFLRNNVFAPLGVSGNQVEMGHTFDINQDAREPWYNHNGYTGDNVFYPAYHPQEFVWEPYGSWDHEARIGQGGVVASPIAVLRFLGAYRVNGDNIGVPTTTPATWNHTGGFPGTSTLARQRSDGINYVVLFNKQATYGDSYSNEIRGILDDVLGRISDWPTADVTWTNVNEFTIPNGQLVSGGLEELEESDDLDLVARRNVNDVRSRIFIEARTTSRVHNPVNLQVTLEGAVFARGRVDQSVDLFNHRSQQWERVDTRAAAQFIDRVTTITPDGDLIRFVDPQDGTVMIRCRFESVSPRQQFALYLDQLVFRIQ